MQKTSSEVGDWGSKPSLRARCSGEMSPSPDTFRGEVCGIASLSGKGDGAGEVEGNAQISGLGSWGEGAGVP